MQNVPPFPTNLCFGPAPASLGPSGASSVPSGPGALDLGPSPAGGSQSFDDGQCTQRGQMPQCGDPNFHESHIAAPPSNQMEGIPVYRGEPVTPPEHYAAITDRSNFAGGPGKAMDAPQSKNWETIAHFAPGEKVPDGAGLAGLANAHNGGNLNAGTLAAIERGCAEIQGGAGAHCGESIDMRINPNAGTGAPPRDPWNDSQPVIPISANVGAGPVMSDGARETSPGFNDAIAGAGVVGGIGDG